MNKFISVKNTQQVETVGDKYMAVSGLPDECENHAVSIARLALDMIDKADSVKMGNQPIVSRNSFGSVGGVTDV